MKILSGLLLTLFSISGIASVLPSSVTSECTTNGSIYFETKIRSNDYLDNDLKRSATLKALGHATSDPNFAV